MTADPMEVLRQPVVPVAPRQEFATALRRRIERELGATTQIRGGDVTTSPTPTPVPERLRSVTPYLCARDAARAIAFYEEVFGATQAMAPLVGPDGRIGHAELLVGDSVVMVADEHPEIDVLGPASRGGTTVSLTLYVADADATFARAVAAGAQPLRPVELQPYGARAGKLRDPFGHEWIVSTQVEEVPAGAMEARFAERGYRTGREAAGAPAAATGTAAVGQLGYFCVFLPDAERARAFYAGLFGWEFEPGDGPRGYHHAAHSAPPGGVLGGKEPELRAWFRVDDVRAAVARVRALGGRAEEPQESPSGLSADCRDDQGVAFGLWQPAPGH